jgi:hypothetical protein
MDLMNHNPDIIDRLVDLAVRLHPDSDAGSAMCDAADEIDELRKRVAAIEGRLEASRDFCDHYRKSIAEAIHILESPYLTVGGTAEAYGLLRKAVGQ